ncbi:ribonucleotide-diphosphate reductase subunit alpha [Candidatus Micrarchaeota archaeon]|nr:MAG: ribonucleotide-diphosphate reductase subunit alpha [Candidatus Micrarchaeota archaeon]
MVVDYSLRQIRKREGNIVDFDPTKITIAILKAMEAVGKKNETLAKALTDKVVQELEDRFDGHTIPGVEDIQDIVETVLIMAGQAEVAKAYILYREERARLRKIRALNEKIQKMENAMTVLKKRYLQKDLTGKVIETPAEMFRRVAKNIAQADLLYDPNANVKKTEEEFFDMMSNFEFIPNSPCLMNAGTVIQQLSACFVLPVEDSLDGIFDAVKYTAKIHQSGGGTGFSFSRLRPKGDVVKTTRGVASGPVSFMRVFDVTTDVIKQGGKRRGANMGVLRVDHPDIVEFITAKMDGKSLTNFNISVGATDEFMEAVKKGEDYELINPRTKKPVGKLNAKQVFDLIVNMAWKNGDPGMIFLDTINKHNPTPDLGEIEATNPCGEQPLLPYESCNLGHINLAKLVKDGDVNWDKLRELVHKGVHFLDNVIDMNKFPLKQIEEMSKTTRKIGLGVMGFADMLIQLGIPYDSEEALQLAEKLMKFIKEESHKASQELAKKRGNFPAWDRSIYGKQGIPMRNAAVTTIAPTGTTSIIAGCSSSIEPLFAICFVRKNILDGEPMLEVNPYFEKVARERGFYSEALMERIAAKGSVQDMEEVPDDVKRIFVTALDIKPEDHIKMQAVFQKYVDSAVSKTINMPNSATVDDVRKAYLMAYEMGCKGITIYRDGSRAEQVLNIGVSKSEKEKQGPISYENGKVTVEADYAGGCPTCHI